MTKKLNKASQWRIELAKELVEYYKNHKDIKMIVLGGSPSKGLSDAYSDLDIIVTWNKIDVDFLENIPVKGGGIERKFFRKMGESDVYLESYYMGNLKVDFGHASLKLWEEWCDDVLFKFDATPWKLKSLSGFSASIILHGHDFAQEQKKKIANYPDELAENVIKTNLGMFVEGYLRSQCLERGEVLAFYDGASMTLKKLLNILGGLNKVYFSADEPRWIEYELNHMEIKPENMWQRIKEIFDGDKYKANDILEELIAETFDLVEKHMPQLDKVPLIRKRRAQMLVAPCDEKPKFEPTSK